MENFHITLRFIGDIDERVAEEVIFKLGQIEHGPFHVCVNGLEVFGAKKPRTLFAAIRQNSELDDLQIKHERVFRQIGLAAESRKYAPHVTLARLGGVYAQQVTRYIEQQGEFLPLEFNVEGFALFSAKNSVGGGPYIIEEKYEF